MFSIIRLFIGCAFCGCSFLVIKKSQTTCKRILYIIFTGISIVLITVFAFLPFENFFITFSSPKAAYEYFDFGKSNIELVVEGNDCDFVIDRKKESDAYLIIPKTARGWKVGIGSNTKRIAHKLNDGITVSVYQYKNTTDYFISILDIEGGESNISDDYYSEFYSLERKNEALGKTFVTYYAHIPYFNSQYSVMVGSKRITFDCET